MTTTAPRALLGALLGIAAFLGSCGDGDEGDDARAGGDTTSTAGGGDVTISEVVAEPDAAEKIVLVNHYTDIAADVGGWQLVVGDDTLSIPFSTKIEPGGELTVHRGSGTDTPTEVHAELREPVIDEGEPIELRAGDMVVATHEGA